MHLEEKRVDHVLKVFCDTLDSFICTVGRNLTRLVETELFLVLAAEPFDVGDEFIKLVEVHYIMLVF